MRVTDEQLRAVGKTKLVGKLPHNACRWRYARWHTGLWAASSHPAGQGYPAYRNIPCLLFRLLVEGIALRDHAHGIFHPHRHQLVQHCIPFHAIPPRSVRYYLWISGLASKKGEENHLHIDAKYVAFFLASRAFPKRGLSGINDGGLHRKALLRSKISMLYHSRKPCSIKNGFVKHLFGVDFNNSCQTYEKNLKICITISYFIFLSLTIFHKLIILY